MAPDQKRSDLDLQCFLKRVHFGSAGKVYLVQPHKYQLSKSIVHEIKFGDIAVM